MPPLTVISESAFYVKYIFKSFTQLNSRFSPESSLRRQSGMSFFQRPVAFIARASRAHDKYRA
jgi:hypothetical protein